MNVFELNKLNRRRTQLKDGVDMPFYDNDLVYLPSKWRNTGLPDYQKPLYEAALQRPWRIKKISYGGRNPNYELEQQNVPDNQGMYYKMTDYATSQDLKQGFHDFVAREEEDEKREHEGKLKTMYKNQAGDQLIEFSRKSHNLEAWSKLNCATVEDCQKIIRDISNFLKDYPPIRDRLYKSLEGRMRFRMKKKKRPRKKSKHKTKRKSRKPKRKPKRKSRKPKRKSRKPKRKSRKPKRKIELLKNNQKSKC